jgi:2-methylisocitrate lyase-like PEP mutase family enzyme
MFKLGDKFLIKEQDFMIEICGIMPGGQGVRMETSNENHYRVVINGHASLMSEAMLNMFLAKVIEEQEKQEAVAQALKFKTEAEELKKQEKIKAKEEKKKKKGGKK